MVPDELDLYEQGGKKRNSATSAPGYLQGVNKGQAGYHVPSLEHAESHRTQGSFRSNLSFNKHLHPVRPCLRVRSESDGQMPNGGPPKGQLNIRWHDISGCGELVEVHEYEPRWVHNNLQLILPIVCD